MRPRPIEPASAQGAVRPHVEALRKRLGRAPRAVLVHAAPAWRGLLDQLDVVGHVSAGRPLDPETHRVDAADRSVDLVLTAHLAGADDVLEGTLDELHRVLRPGGLLLVLERAPRRWVGRVEAALQARFEGPAQRGRERFPRVGRQALGDDTTLLVARRRGRTIGHFDNIADEYEGELPEHLVDLYRGKKLTRIVRALERAAIGPGARGLDLGCGIGLYAADVAGATGARMAAVDASPPSLAVARREHGHPAVTHSATDATRLPFADDSFDFAYTINLLHHLKRSEQREALHELHRVLRPGGVLLVFEIHVGNPLFRWYMRKVFPYTRRIDRGDEEFLAPEALPLGAPFQVDDVETYTFVPDFLPRPLMAPARAVERVLEKTPLARLGIHQTVVLHKPAGRADVPGSTSSVEVTA